MTLKKILKRKFKELGELMKGDLRGWDLRPKVTLEEEDILEPSTQRSQEEWEWGGSGLWATG